ncbi:MAG: DUF2264 domain-containing protein [Puniceicoccaceae bacterium]|nr:MAG: DUF2264 domain-containing protein [Puniceicoccaceae bacterium]
MNRPAPPLTPAQTRGLWLDHLLRMAEPVLQNLADGRLRAVMPVEACQDQQAERACFTHLEALGRTLAGLAPWLELAGLGGEEARRQARWRDLALRALIRAVDPASPDAVNFSRGRQPVVDAAFLCLGLLRAPRIWHELPAPARENLVAGLRSTRSHLPAYNNWLLFSAAMEAFFSQAGRDWDPMRVDFALRKHEEWFLGDGIYGDGPRYHADYYNSFVIQPFLHEILRVLPLDRPEWSHWKSLAEKQARRGVRQAALLERLISPEGTLPPLGRSLTYRTGILQQLALAAWRGFLPPDLRPGQVRAAITAVIRRLLEAPGTYDAGGWLRIGYCGHQPSQAEHYISTGSLYLATAGFLPLGLPPEDPFWSEPDLPWTSQRLYAGEDLPADHAVDTF